MPIKWLRLTSQQNRQIIFLLSKFEMTTSAAEPRPEPRTLLHRMTVTRKTAMSRMRILMTRRLPSNGRVSDDGYNRKPSQISRARKGKTKRRKARESESPGARKATMMMMTMTTTIATTMTTWIGRCIRKL